MRLLSLSLRKTGEYFLSFNAGSVCLFNCDQNGRDLPDDNCTNSFDASGRSKHACCEPHYFLILSIKRLNERISTDWSQLAKSSEQDRIKTVKLCTAIPLDTLSTIPEIISSYIYSFEELDYVENQYNPNSKRKIEDFKQRNSAALCNQICKLNVGKAIEQRILFYVSPKAFDEIIKKINKLLEDGRYDLENTIRF